MIELAATLRAEVDRAAAYLSTLGEGEVVRCDGKSKWVKKEVLGHLIDSAANNHQRFVRAQFGNPFTWPGYDQEAWVSLHRYRERPWAELLGLWVALNRQIAAVMEGVPAETLATVCHIGEADAASLEWWMRDYLRHLKHHLGQLESR